MIIILPFSRSNPAHGRWAFAATRLPQICSNGRALPLSPHNHTKKGRDSE